MLNDERVVEGSKYVALISSISMGMSGSNTWRYVNVPYVWPYELWGYSLKFRPEK
jgi:hypothetical protein